MTDLSKYSNDVLKKLVEKMNIEDETKNIELLKVEVKNWKELAPTIKIKELEEIKEVLEYQIYDLFNIKKLPIKYKEFFNGRENVNNAKEYIDYYHNLKNVANKYKIESVEVKAIKKKEINLL